MDNDMQQVINLFVSLITNITGGPITSEGRELINMHDNLMCEGDFLRDEIVVELPMNIQPRIISPKTGVYKCGENVFSILVSVHDLGQKQAGEDVLVSETLSLNCSLTLWKNEGEIRGKMTQADTIQQLLDIRNDYPNLPREDILTILANRTNQRYGSNIYYCRWNLQVHTGVSDYLRKFAIIISIHVAIREDTLTDGPEPTDEATESESTTETEDDYTEISTEQEKGGGERNIFIFHLVFISLVIQKLFRGGH